MIRLLTPLLLVLFLCTCVRAQKSAADSLRLFAIRDSLRNNSINAPTAEARFNHYHRLVDFFGYADSTLAARRIDTLMSMSPQENRELFQGRAILLRANLQRYHGHSEEAKNILGEVISFFTTARDTNMLATTLYKKSRYFMPARQYDSTLLLAQQAYELYRATDNSRGQLNTLNAMGMVQRRMGNIKQAGEYFERALPLARKHSNRSGQITVLTNLAIVRQSEEDYEKAQVYYQEGLKIAQQIPVIRRQLAYLRTNLSGMYSMQHKYDLALTELQSAAPWFEQSGSQREKTTVLQGLANLHHELGDNQTALTYAQRGLATAGEQQGLREQAHEILAKVYRNLGQADSCYHHLEIVQKMRNEASREAMENRTAELETRFQTREKQLEIERLEEEEILSTQRFRRRGYILAGSLTALALLGWLLWRNLRQRRLIEEQNDTITKALGEKELLLKEIHHRVKNNLQMVSSLLNMQTHYIEDAAAADALQLGRSRVRSMALIHQKLYMGDDVSTLVDAKDYLERLVREILDTHAPPETNINLQLDVEPLELDIDTVVPLGLLTNEAVTNAVKYAFAGRTEGQLKVRLWHRDGRHTLTVSDDGPGMRKTADKRESFGQLLMTTLAEQLDGTLETKDEGNGVEVVVRF